MQFKEHHRPLASHPVVSLLSSGLLFAAFLLFLLVALSLPIIKPIYILSVKSTLTGQVPTDVASELRFGVLGMCATSVLNPPTWFTNDGECFGPMLGYNLPQNISELAGVSPVIVAAVEESLLVILVLHLIAAGVSFFGFISSFFLGIHAVAILTLIIAIIAAIAGTVVFAIDLALVIVARDKIVNSIPYNIEVLFGPAVWMVLASIIMTWFAVVSLSARVCYCCGLRRYPKDKKNLKDHQL
ncbi:hypothetical protein H2248_004927 [Termitomyces sp. 'cryptogamus']|nr:hypothetical protein H2248_004927 [Termitomyces sp. 'cryptogamus']